MANKEFKIQYTADIIGIDPYSKEPFKAVHGGTSYIYSGFAGDYDEYRPELYKLIGNVTTAEEMRSKIQQSDYLKWLIIYTAGYNSRGRVVSINMQSGRKPKNAWNVIYEAGYNSAIKSINMRINNISVKEASEHYKVD